MKRPIGVWVVTAYSALNALIGVGGIYLLVSGKLPVMGGQQAQFFVNLDVLDYTLSVLFHVSIGLGGVFIYMLRRFALPLFVSGVGFNLTQTIWHIVTRRFMAGVGGQSPTAWVELVLAWLIIFSVICYTASLSRKGVLT